MLARAYGQNRRLPYFRLDPTYRLELLLSFSFANSGCRKLLGVQEQYRR